MKKSILAIGLVAVLFSCKKKEENEFTATDLTGTTVVTGTITKDLFTLAPNGSNNLTVTNLPVPAEGVALTLSVQKFGGGGLYPNSNGNNADGFDVYSATTDATGRYSISAKTNGRGVNATLRTVEFNGTKDTLLGTTVKTGLLVKYPALSGNLVLIKGQSTVWNVNATSQTLVNAPNVINAGTATLTGTLGINYVKKRTNFNLDTTLALSGATVYLEYDRDPVTLQKKIYTATSDATGRYTFTINTPNQGVSNFNQQARIWVNDRAATRDTFTVANSRVTGRAGVYSQVGPATYNNIYSTVIRNQANLTYTNFTQD